MKIVYALVFSIVVGGLTGCSGGYKDPEISPDYKDLTNPENMKGVMKPPPGSKQKK